MGVINTAILVCSLVTGVAAVISIFISLGNRLSAPNKTQNKRLDEIEKRLDKHDDILAKDNRRLENIEDGNRVLQRGVLALLNHGLDGNEIESMKKAKEALNDFLIER